jgi:galactosylxylosylprotein 3-beta-galactosyltransferase
MPKIKLSLISIVVILITTIFSVHYFSIMQCSTKNKKAINKSKFQLIILVLSGPNNIERRDTIRKTWLSLQRNNVKNFFPIGMIKLRPEQKQVIQSENQQYKDLLLLPRLFDSYGSITTKILHSFIHIYENYDFDFLLKGDDDSFILVDQILNDLNIWQKKGSRKELYWGYFNGRATVKKSGPWKETDWFLCDYYLPYALGGGYILSYNLVKFIAKNVDVLK